MAGNMDQSLITNVEFHELSIDFSLTTESSEVENSVSSELQNDKSGTTPVSPMTVSDGTNPKLITNVNSKEYYYKVIKPQCPNLEYSYSELFSDRMKEPGFIKEFVAKRIAAALDKVKKSQSLLTLSESQDKNVLNKGFINTANIQRSLECLNESVSSNLGTSFNTSLPKENNDLYVATKCHKLRKSFSFSGISNLNKNESLIDMEMELEDSVPSEDEIDEMGLPVRKFLFCGTPQKKKHDITETIQKYKKILRESFGEPSDDVNNFVEEEAVPAPTYVNQPASSLLSDVQDVHLKKTTSKAAPAKGPMKALMPLQNMTKQVSAILSSPFKKKKVKMVNVPKDSSHISDDSFNFLDSHPVAVSTPTSGSRGSRNETIGSKNRSYQRSFSEERVSNKASDITQTISHIKSTTSLTTANNTKTINKIEKTSTKSVAVNNTRQSITNSSKPVRYTGLKRPSTAPVSIKAPLTTKLNTNINQNSKLGEIAKPSTSKLSTNRNVAASQSILNSTRTVKLSGSSDKKTLFMPKLRKPSSHINKENK